VKIPPDDTIASEPVIYIYIYIYMAGYHIYKISGMSLYDATPG